MEFYGQVLSEAVKVPDASETTADLLTGDTVIPLARIGDFVMGTHVQIDGNVYAYDDDLTDDGEESGVRSITLTDPLTADVAEGTAVYSWNPNANGGAGEINAEWLVQVTAPGEEDGHPAYLLHTLVAMLPADKPVAVGDSVRVKVDDDDGSWMVTNIEGSTPGYDPGFFVSGGIGTDTVIYAGTENGRRAQLDGIDGALEAYNAANEQTVNLDGANNYVEGTFATAAEGSRVALGEGGGTGFPTDEVRIYSGEPSESLPTKFRAGVLDLGGGVTRGITQLFGFDWSGAPGELPSVELTTGSDDGSVGSAVDVTADQINLNANVTVGGTVDATMSDGSVGTGTFQTSVIDLINDAIDALIAGAPGALDTLDELAAAINDDASFAASVTTALAGKQAVHANLTALSGLTLAANKAVYTDGGGTLALADFTALAQSLAAVSTAAAYRTAILAKDKRPGVNTQTANYTIAASDEDVRVQINSATAKTVTLPSDTTAPTLPTNFESTVTRLGAGTVTFVADTGVTIDSRGGLLGVNGQYGVVNIKKRASNRWIIWGDLV